MRKVPAGRAGMVDFSWGLEKNRKTKNWKMKKENVAF